MILERRKKPKRVYLTSQKAHREVMQFLLHMHEHQLEILTKMENIMTAFDDLARETEEMKAAVGEALVKMQELIDRITANPADTAVVVASAAAMNDLQTAIRAAIDAIPPVQPDPPVVA